MGLDSEKRLFLRKDAKRGFGMPKELFMMQMMQCNLVISESTIVAAYYNTCTSIRISVIFKVDKNVRRVSFNNKV